MHPKLRHLKTRLLIVVELKLIFNLGKRKAAQKKVNPEDGTKSALQLRAKLVPETE
jgi:hypothetical protein